MVKEEVAKRLKIFGIEKFGKLSILASNLDMLPQSLQKYTSGESLPGAEILSKLSDLGCDIEWLLLRKENPSDTPGNDNESLNRKDRIILSQAEELTMMKVKLEELKQRILELEEESRIMSSKIDNKKMKQVKEESKGKQNELK